MYQKRLTTALLFIFIANIFWPILASAQIGFNPDYIISDNELQDFNVWGRQDIQNFLEERGSYLRNYAVADASGTIKTATDIIYDASRTYQINPKYILVTLQKEQSLITDDSPTQKQLDWAAGYAVCDGCSMNDLTIQKHKGFGKQIDDAAGVMRWYYNNTSHPVVKQKNQPLKIDNTEVIPQNWATAFLYTYTPHLHGNKNFWRIWDTWFSQVYPDGTLLKNASSSEVYLIQNGLKRKFKNQTALITRANPQTAVSVAETELSNYPTGPEIILPNYSILKNADNYYLLDYDTLRPFASSETVRRLGYNPDEIIAVTDADLTGYTVGAVITASTTAPLGIIYQITDLDNTYFLLKDDLLKPITDKSIITINFQNLKIEKHARADLKQYPIVYDLINFKDGTLLQSTAGGPVFVVANGKKRKIADDDTFRALGYNRKNIVAVKDITLAIIPNGEPLYLNANLLSARDKYLGDNEAAVEDLFGAKLPAYLVAEYPSGRILSGKNIDERRKMASFTKILTAYEALNQNLDLDRSTAYDSARHNADNGQLELLNGEKIKNSDLIDLALAGSSSNAANMIATAVDKNEAELVEEINLRLKFWGADNTAVADLTGINTQNASTPRDLLKIFTKTLQNETIKTALSKTKFSFKEVANKNKINTRTLKHTNELIDISGRNYQILASKTGDFEKTGSSLLMLIESRIGKKQYVILTMDEIGEKKDFYEADKIARWVVEKDGGLAGEKPPLTTTKATGYRFDKNLKNGDNNEDVRQLQLLLKKLGYYTYATATGKFGADTKKAVIKFQKAKKLPAVGTVGPATRAVLNKL